MSPGPKRYEAEGATATPGNSMHHPCRAEGAIALLGALLGLVAGCGSSSHRAASARIPAALVREARPIGRGPRFHPPARGSVIGPCGGTLGPRRGVHVELFAANRVVIVAAGIGTRPPRRLSAGRISGARCYGTLVTLEPTGVVLVRPGTRLRLAELFRSWRQPLSARRLASFAADRGGGVSVFVDGRQWHGRPGQVPLTAHSEIVLEVGPHVPPHASYTFPPRS
jgi:hypothetical protein